MTDAIKYINCEFSPILLVPPIPSGIKVKSNPLVSHSAPKKQSWPYPLTIKILDTVIDIENIVRFECQISAHFKLYKMVTIYDIYEAHLKTTELFQNHLVKNGNHPFLKHYKVHEFSLKEVEEFVSDTHLFKWLITGLSLN